MRAIGRTVWAGLYRILLLQLHHNGANLETWTKWGTHTPLPIQRITIDKKRDKNQQIDFGELVFPLNTTATGEVYLFLFFKNQKSGNHNPYVYEKVLTNNVEVAAI